MTDKVKCHVCNGSGYVGPKQANDTPSEMRIIGCAPCSFCKGGYKEPFTLVYSEVVGFPFHKFESGSLSD